MPMDPLDLAPSSLCPAYSSMTAKQISSLFNAWVDMNADSASDPALLLGGHHIRHRVSPPLGHPLTKWPGEGKKAILCPFLHLKAYQRLGAGGCAGCGQESSVVPLNLNRCKIILCWLCSHQSRDKGERAQPGSRAAPRPAPSLGPPPLRLSGTGSIRQRPLGEASLLPVLLLLGRSRASSPHNNPPPATCIRIRNHADPEIRRPQIRYQGVSYTHPFPGPPLCGARPIQLPSGGESRQTTTVRTHFHISHIIKWHK